MKKVDVNLVNSLCQAFEYKKHGVDCVLMRETYLRSYPDTCPPEKKQKKGRKKKKRRGNPPGTTCIPFGTIDCMQFTDTDVGADTKADVTTTTSVTPKVNVETDVTKVIVEVVVENPQESISKYPEVGSGLGRSGKSTKRT